MDIIFEKWKNSATNAFSYYFDGTIPAGETRYLRMPRVTPNKRGVNDIGFAYQDGIVLYATLSEDIFGKDTIWQKIEPFDEINKTVACIKIINEGESNAKVNIRAILN